MAAKGKRRMKAPAAAAVVRELQKELKDQDAAAGTSAMVQRFELAMQNRFRGSEDDVRRKLLVHLATIQRLGPPQLPWIDLGCGRGEWIAIAAEAGAQITGIDRNQFAVEQCFARHLPVVHGDALGYLQSLADGTCAVVTAFHVLENWEFARTLETLREAARVLAPGGVFVLETPNPANPRVSGYQFWLDPLHLRLLPWELIAFTLEHFGLRVAHLEEINPDHQYGPEDYSIAAAR